MAAILGPAIREANDFRVAVAFVSRGGLAQIMPAIHVALASGAYAEFLIGMDTRATDPDAVKDLYTLTRKNPNVALLCFASRTASSIYHPKMYLARAGQLATAIIGSSNLTLRGLLTNIEANLVVCDDCRSEIVSEIYSTYNRLKYHPNRVIPDDGFIDVFTHLCHEERSQERRLTRETVLRELRDTFIKKAEVLQRPKPTRSDLFGWLELVYDALPDEEFANQQIYEYESEFRQHYPQNQNIRAKIRQQLQFLHKLGFIEHSGRGVWRKVG